MKLGSKLMARMDGKLMEGWIEADWNLEDWIGKMQT